MHCCRMSFCSSKNHQDKVVEVVATVASSSTVIDLISDDDEECGQERIEECGVSTTDSSRTTTFTSQPPNNENNDQYEEQIITFQSILPQINRNDTRQYLITARWNVEDAIHTALHHHHTTKDGNATNVQGIMIRFIHHQHHNLIILVSLLQQQLLLPPLLTLLSSIPISHPPCHLSMDGYGIIRWDPTIVAPTMIRIIP